MTTVFYAWQNDTDSKLNRYLIRDALGDALKQLKSDADITDAPALDHDTKGIPGTPSIAETIFEKIQHCDVFVADLTFVGKTSKSEGRGYPKPLPNANVLIELGLAAASVGWHRIVLVMNDVFGDPAELPFDLRHRTFPLTFSAANGEATASTRKSLAASLRPKIKDALKGPPKRQPAEDERKVSVSVSAAIMGRRGERPERIIDDSVVNVGHRPVVIKSAGLLTSTNEMAIEPLSSLGPWPLPKRLLDGESVSVVLHQASLRDKILKCRQAGHKGHLYIQGFATDTVGKCYRVDLAEGLEAEILRP